jgi:hypothetical protein
MREKERIVRIIELIGRLWDKFPDMRFTQLIENFVGNDWNQEDKITEAKIIKAIKFYIKVEKKNKLYIKKHNSNIVKYIKEKNVK